MSIIIRLPLMCENMAESIVNDMTDALFACFFLYSRFICFYCDGDPKSSVFQYRMSRDAHGSLGRVRRCKSKHPSRYPAPSGPVFQHPLFFAPRVSAPSPLVVGYEHSHPQRGLFQTWGRAEFSWIKLVLMNIALWYSIILKLTFKTSKMNFSKLWKLWKTGVLKLWKPLENRGLKLWKLWKWTLENSGHHVFDKIIPKPYRNPTICPFWPKK